MGEKKKILVVSDRVCYPPNEGNCRRIYNIIRLMQSLGCIVHYLYFSTQRSVHESQMKQFLGKDNYIFCRVPQLKSSFWFRHSKGNYIERYALPNNIDLMYSPELDRKVLELTKKKRYDVVWLEYLCQSKILEKIDHSIIKVIDTHDRFAYRNYKVFPISHKVSNYSITFMGERKALSRADYVIAIQQEEEKYFQKLLRGKKTNVATLGDSHDIVRNKVPNNHNLCFIGGCSEINADAVIWFIDNVLPIITEHITDCKFLIAGKVCEIISGKKAENVQLLGMVENIDEIYSKCRLVVNPVRTGTGLNIKSIEAIAHCKPLVATSVGARGLKYKAPIVEIADDSTLFAQMVIKFLMNDAACEYYRKNCIHFMQSYNKNNIEVIKRIVNFNKIKF